MSFADSWTSQNPKVGNSALPGFGECRIPAEKNVGVNMKHKCSCSFLGTITLLSQLSSYRETADGVFNC